MKNFKINDPDNPEVEQDQSHYDYGTANVSFIKGMFNNKAFFIGSVDDEPTQLFVCVGRV